jgi:outer membrane protein OmpA-like peptidoglycan-associated protein
MKHTLILLLAAITLATSFTACKQRQHTDANNNTIKLRFTLDADENIVEEDVRQQITAICKGIDTTSNKMMMYVYTEQTGSTEQNIALGKELGHAVKQFAQTQSERAYYDLGVDVRGYENPIDSLNPASLKNRRIEVRPL